MAEQREASLETRGLVKVYGDGDGIRALDGVDLSVASGDFVSIMGPSGSGKSTLLNVLGALDRPTSGTVLIGGRDLATVRDLDTFRGRTVGFIFQLHNLIPTLTARENVEVPMRGQPIGARARRRRAEELIGVVGLAGRANHLPNQMSAGERQRVAIARSLANRPEIILADEPTGNLDSQSGAAVIGLMHRLNHEFGTTFIIVTHDDAVARQADRILIMRDGRIVHEHRVGTPFDEDLAAFRRSGLGRAIVAGDEQIVERYGPEGQAMLSRLLGNAVL